MADHSGIEWTDATWNPIAGCTPVSPGCDHCYAARETSGRLSHLPTYAGLAKHGVFTGEVRLIEDRLTQPLRWHKPRRVFVNSMSDLFHDNVPDDYIARVWQVMASAPAHTYQILTKRHARMRSWVSRWYAGEIEEPFDIRPVAGFPGYSVTTTGEVRGKRSDTAGGLSEDVGEQGHRRVTMHRSGSGSHGERALVHRLVLEAFVRRARLGEQACHRNGDPSDNRLSNLYWGTQHQNWGDRLRHGNGRSWAKLTEADVVEIRRRCAAGESAYRVAKDYPVSDTQVRNIVQGDQWSNPPAETVVRKPGRALLSGVWLGVSVETQQWANIRIPALLQTPAAVRWISAEPLLGPVNLFGVPDGECDQAGPGIVHDGHAQRVEYGTGVEHDCDHTPGIDWVVVGGESGPGARPMHPDWARSLRDQCWETGVPFLFKQWGEWAPWTDPDRIDPKDPTTMAMHPAGMTALRPDNPFNPFEVGHPNWSMMRRVGKHTAGRELDGRTWDEYPEALHV